MPAGRSPHFTFLRSLGYYVHNQRLGPGFGLRTYSTITKSCCFLRTSQRLLGVPQSCLQRTSLSSWYAISSCRTQSSSAGQGNDHGESGRQILSQATTAEHMGLDSISTDMDSETSASSSRNSERSRHISPKSASLGTGVDQGLSDARQAAVHSQAANSPLLPSDKFLDARARLNDAIIFKRFKDSRRRAVAYQVKLEKELVWASRNRGVHDVQEILRLLVEKYAVQPTAAHYEAMIRANGDAEHGSIDSVRKILQEMEQENLIIGTSIYQAILAVLAVHPDHLFHAEIERRLQSQWAASPHPSAVDKISFLTRCGQLEMAVMHLDNLYEARRNLDPQLTLPDSDSVPDYLLPSLLYLLADHQDFLGMLYLLYAAEDWRVRLSTGVHVTLLNIAVESHQLDLIKHIWRKMVEGTHLVPPTTSCHSVLLAASRAGDVTLAESVHDVTGRRCDSGIAVTDAGDAERVRWELLEQTYLTKGDPEGAKRVQERRRWPRRAVKHVSIATEEEVV